MSKNRGKRKKGYGTIGILSLIIIAGLAYLLYLGRDILKEKAADMAAEKVYESILEGMGDAETAEKAKEIVSAMDEEDKKQVEDIVKKYANSENLSELTKLVKDGVNSDSLEEASEYLKAKISDEDMEKFRELYEKYKDVVQE